MRATIMRGIAFSGSKGRVSRLLCGASERAAEMVSMSGISRIGLWLLALVAVVALALTAVYLSVGTVPAGAQTGGVSDIRVTEVAGALGVVDVSWRADDDVSHYRVGYASYAEVEALQSAGRNWLNAFHFLDVDNRGEGTQRIANLAPGGGYAFIVARLSGRFGNVLDDGWSEWNILTLAAAEDCPDGGSQLPSTLPGATPTAVPTPTVAPTPAGLDYDRDDDGLIEVSSLRQLSAMRDDLDGDGVSRGADYGVAFPKAASGMGCPDDGCSGYELTADLDFDTNGDGSVDAGDDWWAEGKGWLPIGGVDEGARWNTVFNGNGHTIANLYVDTSGSVGGLFGALGGGALVRDLRLTGVYVSSSGEAGGLAGASHGTVIAARVDGVVRDVTTAGGLVGRQYRSGTVRSSSAAVTVSATDSAGGLVGGGEGRISQSYATGAVVAGNSQWISAAGGLVGTFSGSVAESYATGAVKADGFSRRNRGFSRPRYSYYGDAGGLVGSLRGSLTDVYATGDVTVTATGGGLVGVAYGGSVLRVYSVGSVLGGNERHGLVGSASGGFTATEAFWDRESSGIALGGVGTAYTKREMQGTGIYSAWSDETWDFGTSRQYPALRGVGPDPSAHPGEQWARVAADAE